MECLGCGKVTDAAELPDTCLYCTTFAFTFIGERVRNVVNLIQGFAGTPDLVNVIVFCL